MDTFITFQYKPAGKRPDDITLTNARTELTPGSVVPAIGDIITIQLASNLREFQESEPGEFKSFQVKGRNFFYTTEKGMGLGKCIRCEVYIIVTDVDDDVVGVDIKV